MGVYGWGQIKLVNGACVRFGLDRINEMKNVKRNDKKSKEGRCGPDAHILQTLKLEHLYSCMPALTILHCCLLWKWKISSRKSINLWDILFFPNALFILWEYVQGPSIINRVTKSIHEKIPEKYTHGLNQISTDQKIQAIYENKLHDLNFIILGIWI